MFLISPPDLVSEYQPELTPTWYLYVVLYVPLCLYIKYTHISYIHELLRNVMFNMQMIAVKTLLPVGFLVSTSLYIGSRRFFTSRAFDYQNVCWLGLTQSTWQWPRDIVALYTDLKILRSCILSPFFLILSRQMFILI